DEIKVTSGGTTESVAVHFASSYDGRKPLPLVLDLHPSGGNAAQQAAIGSMQAAADEHGFVVAWPEGGVRLPQTPEGRYWNIPGVPLVSGVETPADARDDVKFLEELIAQLTSRACIDADRVFVTGFSGAARMSSHLACALGDRIAAIAPVGGLRAGRPDPQNAQSPASASCKPERPVAVVAFHGTDDAVNPYQGGGGPHWGYSIPAALERWAALNGCSDSPERTKVASDVTRVSYRDCEADVVVELYLIDAPRTSGGGHTWPGSDFPTPEHLRASVGRASESVDATQVIARF